MSLLKKILKPFSVKEKIKKYFIDNDYIVIIRKSKYAIVKVNGETLFNNLKTNQNFRKWFREFKKKYSKRIGKHRLTEVESIIYEHKLISSKTHPKVKKLKEIVKKDLMNDLQTNERRN